MQPIKAKAESYGALAYAEILFAGRANLTQ